MTPCTVTLCADAEHVVVAVRCTERLELAPSGADAKVHSTPRNLIDHVQCDAFDVEELVAADAWPGLDREHAPRLGCVGKRDELKAARGWRSERVLGRSGPMDRHLRAVDPSAREAVERQCVLGLTWPRTWCRRQDAGFVHYAAVGFAAHDVDRVVVLVVVGVGEVRVWPVQRVTDLVGDDRLVQVLTLSSRTPADPGATVGHVRGTGDERALVERWVGRDEARRRKAPSV